MITAEDVTERTLPSILRILRNVRGPYVVVESEVRAGRLRAYGSAFSYFGPTI
jgi:hypothetical protein